MKLNEAVRFFEGLSSQGVLNKLDRVAGRVRGSVLFRGSEGGEGVCVTGPLKVERVGRLVLGARVTFLGGMVATHLKVGPVGVLSIGDESLFNYGVAIDAHQEVSIGKRCMFASFVRVSDAAPAAGAGARIVIGDDVWIAHGAIIEPGVTIGEGSVIAAGSVVTKDIPPRSMALGNPARATSLSLASAE